MYQRNGQPDAEESLDMSLEMQKEILYVSASAVSQRSTTIMSKSIYIS